jgi:hypothetical protein
MKEDLKPAFIRCASAETEKSLSDRIGLPWFEGMQDWDLTAANARRVSEFLKIYESGELNDEERFALMQLIVASLDDLVEGTNDFAKNDNWIKCKGILMKEFRLHVTTIHYWCIVDNNVDEGFPITKYIRPLWEEIKSNFK